VTPSVEVKRPELADAVDPEDLNGNDDEKPNQPTEKRDVTPEILPKPQVEDLQLKKALELLRDMKPAQLQRAA